MNRGLEGIDRDMDKGMEGYNIGTVLRPILVPAYNAYSAYKWLEWLFE